MKDPKTLERIQLMHPKLRAEVATIYDEICGALRGKAFCRFTYTLRTFKEQDDLYAIGRTKPGAKVTNAKGGYSFHNYGLALDIVLIDGASASWDVKKDFDGDGELESSEDEWKGSRDKAIKSSKGKKSKGPKAKKSKKD